MLAAHTLTAASRVRAASLAVVLVAMWTLVVSRPSLWVIYLNMIAAPYNPCTATGSSMAELVTDHQLVFYAIQGANVGVAL